MKSSWKTTVGGILSGAGLAFAQIFTEPGWSRWGMFAAALGSVLLGLSARDNRVSTEEARARKKSAPLGLQSLALALVTCLLLISAVVPLTGCQSTAPQTTEAKRYYALADTAAMVDSAMKVYGKACVLGKVSAKDQEKVDLMHALYQSSYRTAVKAAFYDSTVPAPEEIASLAQSLVTLITVLTQ